MEKRAKIMLLDGDYTHTLQIAAELKQDLDITLIGIGTKNTSAIFRSKYCDVKARISYSSMDEYAFSLKKLIHELHPDMVIPVGYRSVVALDSIKTDVPAKTCLPPTDSLHIAIDKSKTLALAEKIGIDIPNDYTELMMNAATDLKSLPYPLFLKASKEAGRNITGIVNSFEELWRIYESLKREAHGDKILIQEYIDGNSCTYGCGALFMEGKPVQVYGHQELISVPRSGGSGSKVQIYNDGELKRMSLALLSELNWNGIALVEFKKRKDGSFVLMEINPKFWASYSLASKNGYRFASTMVSRLLDIPLKKYHVPKNKGAMVFPLREWAYVFKNRKSESVFRSIFAMLCPPSKWDINFHDLRAWIPDKWFVKFMKKTFHHEF